MKTNLKPDFKVAMVSTEAKAALFSALQGGTEEEQRIAFDAMLDELAINTQTRAEEVMAEYGASYDEDILVQRGVLHPLTSEARKYYAAVIERKGFEGIHDAFPQDEMEFVFHKLQNEHPILSRVDAQSTKGLMKWIFAKPQTARGFWGPICEDIKQIVLGGFKTVNLESSRLSGFIPVCKGMEILGPVWLAEFVRAALYEIMSMELEIAIFTGDGKNKPIGMMKKLSGAVDGVYADKTPVAITNLEPKTMGGIRAGLAKAKTDSAGVCLMVNPETYWAKVFGALAFRAADGTWVNDRLASGEEIITSYAIPVDKMIIGDPINYFLGVASALEITKYEETLAIEDMNLYIAKFYGFGMAKDPNAFFVADLAGITGATIPELDEAFYAPAEPVVP